MSTSRSRGRTELCAATIRALGADPAVAIRRGRLHRDGRALPVTAPHLYVHDSDDWQSARGAADGFALRLRHSEAQLHATLQPSDRTARWVFELLEQYRTEALADRSMPGVAANLRHRHIAWSLAYHDNGFTDTASGMLLYTVLQVCRARVTGEPVVEETEDLLESPRAALAPVLGTAFGGLRAARYDQRGYARHAREIAEYVTAVVDEDALGADAEGADDGAALTLYVDPEDVSDTGGSSAGGTHDSRPDLCDYGIFTTAYDREHAVTDLVRPARLTDLRARLDAHVAGSGLNVRRLSRDVHRLLRVPLDAGWSSGHEEGYVDGRRLGNLITKPARRDVFRRPGVELEPDCHLSVLVDCSGSMKSYGDQVAVFCDVLAHAFELAGVESEVLGFTTGSWNGGRALRDWERAGRPGRPGRLNELCHLVLDEPGPRLRPRRRGLAALLKTDLFREGVDGEAVAWACRRLRERSEQRRILVVVSDGSPMDSATHRVNGDRYLDGHLREVVTAEQRKGTEIVAVGVGAADLGAYYDRQLSIDLDGGPDMRTYRNLLKLIGPSQGH